MFYPDAAHAPITHPRAIPGNFIPGIPKRFVLHTTESKGYRYRPENYFGHWNPPHWTMDTDGRLYQHFDTEVSSRGLENRPSGVETNRAGALQIELGWYAGDIANMPEPMWKSLKLLLEWSFATQNIEPYCTPFGNVAEAGLRNKFELSYKAWDAFNGVCGHQNVPENVHWDPGPIPNERIKYLGLEIRADFAVMAPVEKIDTIKELQEALTQMGIDSGPIDGIAGSRTRAGVRTFQYLTGADVDGVVDPDLYGSVEKLLKGFPRE